MAKRKRSTVVAVPPSVETPVPLPAGTPLDRRRLKSERVKQPEPATIVSDPNLDPNIEDGPEALRASPDSESSVAKPSTKSMSKPAQRAPRVKVDAPMAKSAGIPTRVASSRVKDEPQDEQKAQDPEAEADDEDILDDVEEVQEAASRPPPVNSDYLPLPWKGRLGYACLCTYLRYANPPVFSSRTCRIASIIEQRHPLKDPDMPHHPTKNRPDRDQPADVARGRAYVEALGLANARDIVKMLRWNDRYGIKFFRLSSEMFPFASHDVYGYRLAPFASEVLAEAGKVAAELGHRLTTHPGQFSQLGSPRKEVITASLRDLAYHAELLSLLKLPPQQDRDAIMVLHMGGVFGDKEATLDRFRENYKGLPEGVKKRLVLENDDVSWSVHDLLPICQELNIPLVLDFHHNNIIHSEKIREGTKDIVALYDDIRATWTRKRITQKMHYSEPTAAALTGRQRRKHSPRVATLPPCRPDMDLMIEAKDKEQAVFELMRTFKLPGFDRFNDMIPHVRPDERRQASKRKSKVKAEDEEDERRPGAAPEITEEEISMGGSESRVYWPPGMEDWLRPVKRVVKKKEAASTPAKKAKAGFTDAKPHAAATKPKAKKEAPKKRARKAVLTPSASDVDEEEEEETEEAPLEAPRKSKRRASARAVGKEVDYAEK